MKFKKSHLRKPENRKDLNTFHREVLRKYSKLINGSLPDDYDFAVKFLLWMNEYYELFTNEETFSSTYLPSYKRGQIILVNLGYRIGYELGGAHYGVVLDNDNRKKSGLITVVPFVSKKKKHLEKGLKPWEYELPFPISFLIRNKAIELTKKLAESPVLDELVKIVMKNKGDFESRRKELEERFSRHYEMNIEPLLSLAPKFDKGSIVDVQQILTVSKQRIITPVRSSDALFGVQIPDNCLQEIDDLIIKQYVGKKAESLDKA